MKNNQYIYTISVNSMAYYIIFWYFHIDLFGLIYGTRRPGYPEERVRIFLHPEDDAAGCCPLLLLMVYQRIGSSCFVNDQII